MSHVLPAPWLASLMFLAATGACAQAPSAAAAAPEPYRSALDGYQPFSDETVAPWKEANDSVGRIGGWKAYAKEAQVKPADTPARPAAADPHAGHGEKKQ